VIARNSSFTYKGRAIDVKQVAHELGVRYVLEGSVRKAANRLRVTGQLIEASTGVHIWGHRFEGAPEDIFDLQDQITANVIGATAPQLEQAEIERAKRKPTASLDAYDYYLQGMASYYASNKEAVSEALRLFSKAIGRDPAFASACGMAHGASSGARSMAGRSTAQERQQRPHGLPGVRPRSGLMMPSRFLAQPMRWVTSLARSMRPAPHRSRRPHQSELG